MTRKLLMTAALCAVFPGVGLTQDWAGYAVGVFGGMAMNGDDRVGLDPLDVTIGTLENQGAFGGVQLGIRWQNGDQVIGIAGDLAVGRIEDSVSGLGYDATSTGTAMASIRLVLGMPVGSSLVYLTGGLAGANFDYSVSGTGVDIDESYLATGGTIGLGWEKPISDDWSLQSEYRYTGFSSEVLSDGVQSTRATPVYQSATIGLLRRF